MNRRPNAIAWLLAGAALFMMLGMKMADSSTFVGGWYKSGGHTITDGDLGGFAMNASAQQEVCIAEWGAGTITASSGTALITSGTTAAKTADFAGYGATADNVLYGFGCRETTGSATAAFNLRHGTSDSDQVILPVNLAAGESIPWRELGARGADISSGLFVEVTSGSVEVYLGAATD